jgi:phage protein D
LPPAAIAAAHCCWLFPDLDNPGTNAAEATAAAAANKGSTPAAAGANGQQLSEAEAAAAAAAEAQATEDAQFFRRRGGEEALAYAGRIFDKLYHSDITRLLAHEVCL